MRDDDRTGDRGVEGARRTVVLCRDGRHGPHVPRDPHRRGDGAAAPGTAVMIGAVPRVRVVMVNFNGGPTTMRALEHLTDVDWPRDRLDVVLVDNGSSDGVVPEVRARFPWIRTLSSARNVGFARGCNIGMHDLDGVDHVALLNPDTCADRSWLRPLVDVLAADPGLGAAVSKVVFAPSFGALTIEVPASARVVVTGVEVDGRGVFGETHFREGCATHATRGAGPTQRCAVTGRGQLRIPTD